MMLRPKDHKPYGKEKVATKLTGLVNAANTKKLTKNLMS